MPQNGALAIIEATTIPRKPFSPEIAIKVGSATPNCAFLDATAAQVFSSPPVLIKSTL
jgi:hypothetical protein